MKSSRVIRLYLYKNYVRLEKFRKWAQHRLTLKGWFMFWAIMIVILPGMSSRLSMAYQILCMGFSFFLVSAFSMRKFKPQLLFRRHLPDITRVDQELSYTLMIENTSDVSIDGILCQDTLELEVPNKEDFLNGMQDDKRNVVDRFMGYPRFLSMMHALKVGDVSPLTSLSFPAKTQQTFEMKITFTKRGHHSFYGVKVMQEEGLGLMRSRMTTPLENHIWVFPALWKNLNWKPGWLMDTESETNMTKQKKGDPEILHYLREYQVGDSPKYIHWKSSAKLDRFVVKNFLQEKGEAYGLVLDTYYASTDLKKWEALLSWLSTCLNDQLGSQLEIEILVFCDHFKELKFDGSLSSWKVIMKILSTLNPDKPIQKGDSSQRLLKHMRSKKSWTWLGVDCAKVEVELWKELQTKGKRLQGTFISEEGESHEPLPYLVDTTYYDIGSSQPVRLKAARA